MLWKYNRTNFSQKKQSNSAFIWRNPPWRHFYLLVLWEDLMFLAEMMLSDRIASAALSSTSALLRIRPVRKQNDIYLLIRLNRNVLSDKYIFNIKYLKDKSVKRYLLNALNVWFLVHKEKWQCCCSPLGLPRQGSPQQISFHWYTQVVWQRVYRHNIVFF